MKRIVLAIFLTITIPAISQVSPHPANSVERRAGFEQLLNSSAMPHLGYVNDLENIFTGEQSSQLDSLISHFAAHDSFEIVLITIDTGFLQGGVFDSVAYELAKRWGIGATMRSNGVIIIVSRGSGRIRIYNGYNISALMSYQDTKLLIDLDFLPYYKKKEYYEGTVNGLTELMKTLTRTK